MCFSKFAYKCSPSAQILFGECRRECSKRYGLLFWPRFRIQTVAVYGNPKRMGLTIGNGSVTREEIANVLDTEGLAIGAKTDWSVGSR